MNANILIFQFMPLQQPEYNWDWGPSLVVPMWIRVPLWIWQQRTSDRHILMLLFLQEDCLSIKPLSSPSTQSKLGLCSSDNSVLRLKKKQSQPVTQSLAGQFYRVSNCWGMGNVGYIYPFKRSFRKDTGWLPFCEHGPNEELLDPLLPGRRVFAQGVWLKLDCELRPQDRLKIEKKVSHPNIVWSWNPTW